MIVAAVEKTMRREYEQVRTGPTGRILAHLRALSVSRVI
jgi:hypothetical protein